jgi:hypothetical protein
MYLPRAHVMALLRAADRPLFSCLKKISLLSEKALTTSAVASVDPSSTTMTSKFEYDCLNTLVIDSLINAARL